MFILRDRKREREREKERERAQAGEGQKKRERIPSRFHAVSTEPNMGLNPTNLKITTPAQIESRTLN